MEFFHSLSQVPTEEVVALARLAEELGFAGVTLSDHLMRPVAVASRYPYSADGAMPAGREVPYPDVWVLVGTLAQATRRLRFLSSVYVLPLRNPLLAAKAIATAAVLSGGRVMLGVGVGWMREEFALAGQRFEERGARSDEMRRLLRALWGGGDVEHHGRFYEVPALRMLPAPAKPPPILVGGHSDAALRRAARHDGWVGTRATCPRSWRGCGRSASAPEPRSAASRSCSRWAGPAAPATSPRSRRRA